MVTIRWKPGVSPPANGMGSLRVIGGSPEAWSAHFGGAMEELLAWLAGKPIEDISIGRPDLEALFRQYYQGDRVVRLSGTDGGPARRAGVPKAGIPGGGA